MLKPAGVCAIALCLSGCAWHGEPIGPTLHEHQTVELDQAALTRIQLHMGAGELEVTGGAGRLLDGDFTYNLPGWKPTITQQSMGTERDVEISQDTTVHASGRTENRWQLALNDAAPLSVNAHLGAGQARMTLGSLNLRGIDVEIGAGEATIDLRGMPRRSYHAAVHGGVGSATVYVPAAVGISASASGGLGEISVRGLEKQSGRWINPRAPAAPVTVTLDVQGGVGQITIIAE
jgi:hypothetical protein